MDARSGGSRKDVVIAVVATTLVLGVGVALGATFSPREAPAPAPTTTERRAPVESTAPTPREIAPTLAGAGDVDAAKRLAAIEQQLAALRQELAAAVGAMDPLLTALNSEAAPPVLSLPPRAGIPLVAEAASSGDDIHGIAKSLGLDATRREQMATQFADVLSEVERLEKEHAQVAKDGKVTTIKIGAYAEQGSAALRRWRDWIDRNLSTEEREAYDKGSHDDLLFGQRTGEHDRTIKIDESGGVVQASESIKTDQGDVEVMRMTAPAAARDLALDAYRHLLPK